MMKFRAFAADFEKSQRGLYNIHLPLSSHPQVIKNSMLKIEYYLFAIFEKNKITLYLLKIDYQYKSFKS